MTVRVPDQLIVDLRERLAAAGVAGVTTGWVDNNGIVRSRTVPLAELEGACRRGVGVTTAFAVFDSHDGITFAHPDLATPSGDVRLVPALDVGDDGRAVTPLAGQPGFAWAPGRILDTDGEPWTYDPRAVLERQVARAADVGFAVKAGYELEFVVSHEGGDDEIRSAHRGPAYGPNALRDVDEFARQLLADLDANGLRIGQFHAEYGAAQVELALSPLGALAAADAQVLARQTVHAAARRHGLRVSFAPVPSLAVAGNGWHLHSSLADLDSGANALTGDGPHGLSAVGLGFVAGLVRHLAAVVAVTAPSSGSLLRRRPGFWAGAFGFWGIENREAALRLVPTSPLLGPEHTNVELKACDASANPYLALAVVIAAGLDGVADRAEPPAPVQEDVGTWDEAGREEAGIAPLATTYDKQRADLLGSDLLRDVLGEQLLGAFVACRDADAAWAAEHSADEVAAALRWKY